MSSKFKVIQPNSSHSISHLRVTSPRVCFLDQSGELGGAELCLLDIAAHLSSQPGRARCKVILFNGGPFRERLRSSGVAVSLLEAPHALQAVKRNGRMGRGLATIPAVLDLARRVAAEAADSDLLFANTQKAMLVGAVAARIARKPLLWYLHDIITSDHFGAVNRFLNAALGSFCVSRIVTNSIASKEAFLKSRGRHRNIRVIPNGISPAPFDAVTADDLALLRGELRLPSGPVVGIFSRLAPWKGQRVLLEALPRLPAVQALIVGEALFSGEQAYAAELKRLAGRLGIAGRVRFLGFRSDIARLMKFCDLILHTSIAPEPFGRVIVEAMLAEKPVIATRGGGAGEIVDHMQTGILVPPGDPAALAAAIQTILDAPSLAATIACAGRAKALRAYSPAAMLSAIDEEIDAACNTLPRGER